MTFEAAYALYWPLAVTVAGRILRDREAAEDVAAAALIKCWRNWDRARDPKLYILTATRRAALDALRHRRLIAVVPLPPDDAHPAAAEGPHATASEAETARELAAALARLSPNQRAALWLFAVEGLDRRRAAALLGTTPGTVAKWVCRARRDVGRRCWWLTAGHRESA